MHIQGLGLSGYGDWASAYRILVRSFAHILEVLGVGKSVENVEDVLEDLGAELGSDLIRKLASDLKFYGRGFSRKELEDLQYMIPRLMTRDRRRMLAAYYSSPTSTKLVARLAESYIGSRGAGIVIADPFMGSGALLRSVIERVGLDHIAGIWGIELDLVSCVFGYASLLDAVGGDRGLVRVRCGDAFKIIWGSPFLAWGADVIVTNPPFTRWEKLAKSYREFLMGLMRSSGYSKYITRGQVGLQVLSLFLIDSILRDKGFLVSVLPASTFYTIYGRGVKAMLRERYGVLGLFRGWGASFSIDSGFVELIVAAIKGGSGGAFFVTLSDSCLDSVELRGSIIEGGCVSSYTDLGRGSGVLDMNWLLYFEEPELRPLIGIVEDLLRRGALAPLEKAYGGERIMRGVEMYGPDFFLIPNRFWRVLEHGEDSVTIGRVGSDEQLSIQRDYLVEALRKPSLYVDRILIEGSGHYLVSIPPEGPEKLPQDVRRYIEWGSRSGTAAPAMRFFGSRWYSHVYRQIASKKPFGRLFLPDKVDARLRRRGVFALSSTKPISATKNFYILAVEDLCAPLLTLWFNSSAFLALLIYGGRRIGITWTRYLEEDYLELPTPSPRICEDHYREAEDLLKSVGREPLPPIPSQLGGELRSSIDTLVLKALGVGDVEKLKNNIYNILGRIFVTSAGQ